MTVLSTNEPKTAPVALSTSQLAKYLLIAAILLTGLQYAGLLPSWLHRVPESWIPPFAVWLDAA